MLKSQLIPAKHIGARTKFTGQGSNRQRLLAIRSRKLSPISTSAFSGFSSMPHDRPPDELQSDTTQSAQVTRASRSNVVRCLALMIALVPLAGLGVARSLQPSSSGMGTHQQLGLPPCSMQLLFGIRCPGCGMTTSWAHFTRGNWTQSIQASGGGFLLAVLAVWVSGLGVRSTLTARPPGERTLNWLAVAAVATGAVTLLQWLERIFT
jgi:hypothetical protein